MESEIAEVVAAEPRGSTPVPEIPDRVPEQIRDEAKRSAEIIRASADECGTRMVEAAQARCTQAEACLVQARSYAEDMRARADVVAKQLETHGEVDAQIAATMTATMELINSK